MKGRKIYILLSFIIVILQLTTTASALSENKPMTCEERLKSLEPSKPETIYDYEILLDRDTNRIKGEVLPIPTVQKNGSNVPFVTVYKNLNWQRPAYDESWHSTYWRWSYVPINMAYQQHKLFSYQGGGSWWYDLSHNLALPVDAGGPSPINEYAFTIKYPYVVRLIVFDFDIKSIKQYKGQIVVSGEPLRKGLTVVDFDTKNFSDSIKLIQLSTPDGYEIDYLI